MHADCRGFQPVRANRGRSSHVRFHSFPHFHPLALAFGLFSVVGFSSCSRIPAKPSAELTPTTVASSGSVARPGNVSRVVTSAELPVPVNSTVTANPDDPKRPVSVTLAAPSVLSIRSESDSAVGAVNHEPDRPPTPVAIATASGIRLFYWLAAAFGVAAVVAVWFGYPVVAGLCVGACASLPLLAASAAWLASHAAVAFACVSVGLVAGWFILSRRSVIR